MSSILWFPSWIFVLLPVSPCSATLRVICLQTCGWTSITAHWIYIDKQVTKFPFFCRWKLKTFGWQLICLIFCFYFFPLLQHVITVQKLYWFNYPFCWEIQVSKEDIGKLSLFTYWWGATLAAPSLFSAAANLSEVGKTKIWWKLE